MEMHLIHWAPLRDAQVENHQLEKQYEIDSRQGYITATTTTFEKEGNRRFL